MEIINLEYPLVDSSLSSCEPCVLALGFFDGVHQGHKRLIRSAKEIASKNKLTFAVMTFFPHPSEVFNANNKVKRYLSPLSVKQEIFTEMGVEKLYVVNFNIDFSRLTHKEFVEQYLVGIQCKHVVAGFDFKYGYKGQGDMKQLIEDGYGRFAVTTISKVEKHEQKISSTLIRELLELGRVNEIPDYLGDYYEVVANVQEFSAKHMQATFDCIPIEIEKDYLIPCSGFYEIEAHINERIYEGMLIHSFNGSQEIFLTNGVHVFKGDQIKIRWKRNLNKQEFLLEENEYMLN